MTPRTLSILALLLAIPLLAGCSDCLRCEQEMDRTRIQMGDPEASEFRRDGNILTETWFYYEDARSVVFLWDDRDCSCNVSVYIFEGGEARAAPVAEFRFDTARSAFFRP